MSIFRRISRSSGPVESPSSESPIEVASRHPSSERLLYFHCGAHKTATTSLQSLLRKNALKLAERGIAVSARSMPQMPNIAGTYNLQMGKPLRNLIKLPREKRGQRVAELRRELAQPLENVPVLVLSDEGVIGDKLDPEPTLYPRAGLGFKQVKHIYSDRSARAIFYVRDLAAFVESSFVQSVMMRLTLDWDEFLEKIDLDGLDWTVPLEKIAKVVGEGNLVVRRFEDIGQGRTRFATDFVSLFTDPEGLDLEMRQGNPSLSAIGLELARTAAPMLDTEQWQVFRSLLQKNFSKLQYPTRTFLDEDQRRRLQERYRDQWAQIERRYSRFYEQ